MLPLFDYSLLVSVHPATPDGHSVVSNSEMSNFSQGQGNQGIARRRTFGTSHKRSSRLTPRLRKRAISGWKLVTDSQTIQGVVMSGLMTLP